jgi:methionyl-tRNA formyltransferase
VLLSEAVPIGPAETAATLTTRLAEAGARLIVSWLAQAPQARWTAAAQPAAGVSYARKISKQEAWLDWRQAAAVLAHRVRAFDPEPGARSRLRDRIVKIWSAEAESQPAGAEPGTAVSAQADKQPAEAGARSPEPGTVLAAQADGIRVACGDGVLVIRELQRAGGRRLRAREFLAGTALAAGARWQPPPAPDEAG